MVRLAGPEREAKNQKKVQLKAYNDTDIETHGVCFVKVKLKNGRVFPRVKFVIVPDARGREMQQSILGVGNSERFGLVVCTKDLIKVSEVRNGKDCTLTKDRVSQEYKNIFQGLGCLEGKVSIQLKEDATPVVYPARKVPVALREKLKMELDRLVKNGVIEKTESPTDWVLPLGLVDGSFRICMDPLRVNQSVKREHCHLPERSEIQVEMAGAKFFSKLDFFFLNHLFNLGGTSLERVLRAPQRSKVYKTGVTCTMLTRVPKFLLMTYIH